jgi:hypothetical protein
LDRREAEEYIRHREELAAAAELAERTRLEAVARQRETLLTPEERAAIEVSRLRARPGGAPGRQHACLLTAAGRQALTARRRVEGGRQQVHVHVSGNQSFLCVLCAALCCAVPRCAVLQEYYKKKYASPEAPKPKDDKAETPKYEGPK